MDRPLVVIIGAGRIGKAIEKILQNKGEIQLWDKDSTKVVNQKSLEEIVPEADFLFLCARSLNYLEALLTIKPLLNSKTLIISLAKGLDVSGKTTAEILEKELPNQPFGLLCGPMLSEEIMEGKESFAVFAAKTEDNFQKASNLFDNTILKIVWSKDIQGTAVASVVKNIYSVFFGICDGFNLGNNARGAIFAKVLEEMKGIITLLGGGQQAAEGLAGLGDFFATATSGSSQNHQAGVIMAKTKQNHLTSEGAVAYPILAQRLGENLLRFPLLIKLGEILKNPEEGENIVQKIL